ncbi:MAG: Rieske (2Fe-2S) protein [Sporichthyaceae bacterium]
MTASPHRPSSVEAGVPDEPTGRSGEGPERRVVLRGGAAFGLALAAGWPLAACGGGSSRVAADLPTERGVPAAPTAARATPSPEGTPRTKSQLYRRGKGDVAETDPVPTRTARPAPAATVESPAPSPREAAEAAPSKSDGLSTARRGEAGQPPRGEVAPALARAGDVPVGGGTVFARQQVVVTQPTRGVYRAFDARCTHEQCLVSDCSGGAINCPCHSSKFSLDDGSALAGPARRSLPGRSIEVRDGQIFLEAP